MKVLVLAALTLTLVSPVAKPPGAPNCKATCLQKCIAGQPCPLPSPPGKGLATLPV